MEMKFFDSMLPFRDADLESVERALGHKLPQSLLMLLRKWNGGIPENPGYNKGDRTFFVQYLLPISDWRDPNLRQEIERSQEWVVLGLVPFAFGGKGETFAVAFKDGSVHVGSCAADSSYLEPDIVSFISALTGPAIKDDTGGSKDAKIDVVSKSDDPAVLEAFMQAGNGIDDSNKNGHTIAQLCAMRGNLAMLSEVTRKGASLDQALHLAARFNRRNVVDYLLEQGCDVRQRDRRGKLPIDYVKGNAYLLERLRV